MEAETTKSEKDGWEIVNTKKRLKSSVNTAAVTQELDRIADHLHNLSGGRSASFDKSIQPILVRIDRVSNQLDQNSLKQRKVKTSIADFEKELEQNGFDFTVRSDFENNKRVAFYVFKNPGDRREAGLLKKIANKYGGEVGESGNRGAYCIHLSCKD